MLSPVSLEDLTAQLVSLATELLDLTRRSPHLGYIERDSVISRLEGEYFVLSRLISDELSRRDR
jgi:hypothetical protein